MIAMLVNSRFGVRNTPGGRARHLVEALDKQRIAWRAFAREAAPDFGDDRVRQYPRVLRQLPRLLHAIHIYLAGSWYEHRTEEIRLFDFLGTRWLASLSEPPGAVYCLETAPGIAKWCELHSIPCLMDVQIAPQSYINRLASRGISVPGLRFLPRLHSTEQRAFHSSAHTVVPSRFVRDELLIDGVPPEYIHLARFGSPVTGQNERGCVSPGGRPIRFCFLGAVNARKGVLSLLEAWDHPALHACELHLCGRLFPAVRREIARRKLCNVYTPGFVDANEYLRSSDVFVFPSLMEGSSKAVLEAMAIGLPCIVSHQAGAPVDDSTGIVVDPLDPKSIREAMTRLAGDIELRARLGKAAANRASNWSWSDYGHKLLDIIMKMEIAQCRSGM